MSSVSHRTKAVVGLGNPGDKYATTRHNAGFWVVDEIARILGIKVNQARAQGLIGAGTHAGQSLILAKPLTYMNLSGRTVRALADEYGLAPEDFLIVCDDLTLDPGTIRLRAKGSAGGHNGLKSVIHSLGTDGFARLRIGVGAVPEGAAGVDYVLSSPGPAERRAIDRAVRMAAEAALTWSEQGPQAAMSQYNRSWADS